MTSASRRAVAFALAEATRRTGLADQRRTSSAGPLQAGTVRGADAVQLHGRGVARPPDSRVRWMIVAQDGNAWAATAAAHATSAMRGDLTSHQVTSPAGVLAYRCWHPQ
jgi:hypothetical protein